MLKLKHKKYQQYQRRTNTRKGQVWIIGVVATAVLAVPAIAIAMQQQLSPPTTVPQVGVSLVGSKQVSASSGGAVNSVAGPPSAPAPTAVVKPTLAAPSAAVSGGVVAPAIASGLQLFGSTATANKVATAGQSYGASDAAVLNRLAAVPVASWFGGWNTNIQADVSNYVATAANSGKLPVVVAYNIPNRDCGNESAGGAANAQAYASWIQSFANGINGRQVIVLLEPDAVAADCFNDARAAMLQSAVQTLARSGASVYLDAGHANWRSVGDMTARLNQAGIASATGFSLNISNFQTTAANSTYGSQISAKLGGKHFVIDTSRNGNGPNAANDWCNPAGRSIGTLPTTQTGNALIDAYLWVKVPGESDGACGPAIGASSPPAAGVFWPDYALQLARNAGW